MVLVLPVCIRSPLTSSHMSRDCGSSYFVCGDQNGSNGPEGVKALALVPAAAALELIFALRHIVHEAIARNVVERFGLLDVPGRPAHDHPEFNLPVALCCSRWKDHVIVRTNDAADRLGEDDRLAWERHVRLGGMIRVVEPHGNELAGAPDRTS